MSYGVSETMLVVNEEKCTGCGNCIMACPANVDEKPILKIENGVVKIVDMLRCRRFSIDTALKNCSACVDICPTGAMKFVVDSIPLIVRYSE
jgi:4Fe-4S ferredoxin